MNASFSCKLSIEYSTSLLKAASSPAHLYPSYNIIQQGNAASFRFNRFSKLERKYVNSSCYSYLLQHYIQVSSFCSTEYRQLKIFCCFNPIWFSRFCVYEQYHAMCGKSKKQLGIMQKIIRLRRSRESLQRHINSIPQTICVLVELTILNAHIHILCQLTFK